MKETNSVGASRALEMLMGENQAARWARPIVRSFGFLFLGFVLLAIWLPSKATPAGSQVLRWTATYIVYLLSLEILCRRAKRLYETTLFRLFRIHFNLIMIAILVLVAPSAASSYLWFFFAMPMLAALGYFGRLLPLLINYLEICAVMLVLTLAQGWPMPLDFAAMVAQDAILGLLAAVLYFFVNLFPRLREESTLLETATTLIQVLDQRELCQLLADAAKAGVPASDAAVVHLLGGKGNRTLIPLGSSKLDLTILGRTPMEIGVGIAGHAIQSRETINVPDVDKDDRYHRLPPSFIPFKSLLVAPMYVGGKNVGTISVHSARKGALGKRDERFLTMLAAQGAMAIRNAELYDTRIRRRQQISDILEASRTFGLNQRLDTLLETIAAEVYRCSGYRMAVVNLVDEVSAEIVVRAMAGVPPEGRRKLEGMRTPLDIFTSLLQEEFRVSQSYFIRHDRCPEIPDLDRYSFTPDLGERKLGEWHQEDMLIVPIQTREEELLGYISVDDPSDRQLPSLDTVQALELLASVAATAIQNAQLYEQAQQEITDRKRAEREQERRSREITMLNKIGHMVTSSLDLDKVLALLLDWVRQGLGAEACSVALLDDSGDLVFHHAEGEGAEAAIGLRLKPRESIAGHVAQSGQSALVPDAHADPHFYGELIPDFTTRDMVCVPLVVRDEIIGVIELINKCQGMFTEGDVRVLESVATQAAIAIRNARLYAVVQKELAERKRAEEALRQQNREQARLFEELHERATQLMRLQEVTATISAEPPDIGKVSRLIVDSLGDIFPGCSCTIRLYDSKADEFRPEIATGVLADWGGRSPRPEGTSRYVVKTKTPRYLEGNELASPSDGGPAVREDILERGVKSAAYLPLTSEGDVIGVLYVDLTDPHRFSENEKRILELFADQAAIAIESARLYEETDRLRAFNENIVQSMEEGILLEDANGHITFANRRMAKMLGYAPEELIGQHWTVTAAPEEMAKIEEEVAKRHQGITSRYETVLLTKEGQRVPAIVSATPFFEEGSFTGVLAAFTDITDRKRQETRLRDYLSTVTSSLAQHTSLEGLYEFIVEAGARFLSARDCSLFLTTDGNGNVLELVATTASSPRADRLRVAISTGPGCGLVAHVAEMCKPIRLAGAELPQHPSWNRELWERLGWDFDPKADHSLLAAPMCLSDGRLVGILVARDKERSEDFSEFDERLLETLATNAAADIERVKGLERVRDEAVRAERKRLETDLHEAMNVLATGVRWEAEIISDEIERGDLAAARFALTRLQAARTCAYTDLRYILEDLRDPTLEQEGLLIALRKRAELIGRGRIQVHGDVWERPSPEVEGILYRIGQETMDNAVRHSGVIHDPGVEIEVELERSDEQAKLCVRDNGIGFDVESALALSHKWGLRRLRDMLREMGGRLDIDSVPGKGTTICATIDLTRRNHEQ